MNGCRLRKNDPASRLIGWLLYCIKYFVISLDTAMLATTRHRNEMCNFSPLDNTVKTKVDSELCNKKQFDALFIRSSFRQHLHVSGIFVAHHQEVYCIYTRIGTCCAF